MKLVSSWLISIDDLKVEQSYVIISICKSEKKGKTIFY
ncbi:hypothetical protein ADIWIN_2172 [Winogradskyella psychrotolerans RS-3]|uniref:Uncharacterized protein n=1 Tax=Winogradskyella psychrotolerans RS-3 TaxID=641526 RepID=S7X1E3_9FLAO|nr:hypothetical protein ADIWIN_2172 [Winogradskyella psychrotolerans RS-3]